jgi:predicted RNA binding protein YcfA (HicA-like mRNA interferase family)
MVKEMSTRDVVSDFRAAGFEPMRSDGSHTWWKHSSGAAVAVPDGHRTISAGVVRKIYAKISEVKGQ